MAQARFSNDLTFKQRLYCEIKFFSGFKKATAEIGLLWANIAACIWKFYPINKTASYLMIPYLAWVSIASCLTISIWQKNKDKQE